jgi:hypothetical protein
LYEGQKDVLDEDGNKTGEKTVAYSEPKELRCSVSPASGKTQIEMFGNLDSYDKTVITDDMKCPIDENSVLFVDKSPEEDADGNPLPDYRIRKVAKSLNCISYAISKVAVS